MQQVNISTKKILANLKIDALNEMQLASIKANDENDNVLLLSTTGSGKTIAFLLSINQRLHSLYRRVKPLDDG